jgi:hypothetical protein
MTKKTVTKRPSLKKYFGKFVNINTLVKQQKIYEKFAETTLKPYLFDQVYYNNLLFEKDQYYYLGKGNI